MRHLVARRCLVAPCPVEHSGLNRPGRRIVHRDGHWRSHAFNAWTAGSRFVQKSAASAPALLAPARLVPERPPAKIGGAALKEAFDRSWDRMSLHSRQESRTVNCFEILLTGQTLEQTAPQAPYVRSGSRWTEHDQRNSRYVETNNRGRCTGYIVAIGRRNCPTRPAIAGGRHRQHRDGP